MADQLETKHCLWTCFGAAVSQQHRTAKHTDSTVTARCVAGPGQGQPVGRAVVQVVCLKMMLLFKMQNQGLYAETEIHE